MKKYHVRYIESFSWQTFFTKKEKKKEYRNGFMITAENEEDAIKNIEKDVNNFNKATESPYRFDHVVSVESWDEWTIEEAMKRCNGKEFAEYLKQMGIKCDFSNFLQK